MPRNGAGGLNKMKKLYRKEEGVSPVIATILMVAITVVLAATVYIMVSGLGGGGGTTPLSMKLTYKSSESNATKAVFEVSMTNPTQTDFTNVKITIKDSSGSVVGTQTLDTNGQATIGSISVSVNDLDGNSKLSSGDELVIDGGSTNIGGYMIYVYVTSYSGNAQASVPI